GVTPTPAGEALIHGAPRILANTAIGLERAEATAAGRRGRVVLGALRAFFALGLPSAVQEELRRDHPEIALVLQDLDQPELFEQLHCGGIDLGLGAAPAPRGAAIIVAPLWEETADQALVPAAHALARYRGVTVSGLGDLPLVLPKHGYSETVFERGLDAAEQQGQGAADGRNPTSAGVACGRRRQEHRPGGGAARRRTTERVTATQRVGARRRRPTPGTLRPGSDPHAGRRLPGRGLSGAAPVAGTVV